MCDYLLIVDDDPMIHRMLDFAFRSDGISIVSKLNGADAKEFLEKNHRDVSVLVLDWEMPGITGLELLRQLKKDERFKDIPAVMLTSHAEKGEIQQGIDAGAYYYITKPFNKEFLKSIVRRAVYDYKQLLELKKQLRESQNPFRNMQQGTFRIRTLDEAQKLSLLIANASEDPDRALLICELLYNAVEHGNLGIGYEEKTRLIEENNLLNEILHRLELPEHKNKFATVEVSRENGIMKVLVKDEGRGFDYTRYLQFDAARVFDNHGRGIAIAKSMLDIHYLDNGSRVEVVIPLTSA
ncbi:MAG TPA: response regulator [Chitinophagales bacterium]|nr:response regulator [Chitinophagales bacterium]